MLLVISLALVLSACGASEVDSVSGKKDTDDDSTVQDTSSGDADLTTQPDQADGIEIINTEVEDDKDWGTVAKADSDNDLIADEDEGSGLIDTDNDGTPDSNDLDSDGDGILDSIEAGDNIVNSPPVDSDGDGVPDFQDDDSDDNGVPDAVELDLDPDNDGNPNFSDTDNDGDGIPDFIEIEGQERDCNNDGVSDPAGSPSAPVDCDGNGTPDYMSIDSDGDTISDRIEGYNTDTDGDGYVDRYDNDTDGDGISDANEAGDSNVTTPPVDTDSDGTPDFRDADSDNDGLTDAEEFALGTHPRETDTDNDGVSDLIEQVAGTDPLNFNDNPSANGDFFFLVPYQEATSPTEDTLQFRTNIQYADLYFSFDNTGSMDAEVAALASELGNIINSLLCLDYGTACTIDEDCNSGQVCGPSGTCIQDPLIGDGCIADLYTGYGWWEEIDTFHNIESLQPNPAVTAAALSNWDDSGADEAPLQAPACAADGSQCNNSSSQKNCSTAAGRVGCVGFRSEAIRVYLQITDADNQCSGSRCSTFTASYTGNILRNMGIKFVGLYGSGDSGGTGTAQSIAEDLGTASGTVDSSGNPFVYSALDSAVVGQTVQAIRDIARGVPLNVTIEATDLPGDDGDALQFIDYLEVNVSGAGNCTNVTQILDTNSDGHPDSFPELLPGTRVCWDVHPVSSNTFVQPTTEPLIYKALVTVYGDGSPLNSREVFFLIPPNVSGGIN